MGAMPWKHVTRWHADPNDALRELQAKFVSEHYPDIPSLIQRHLESARQAAELAQVEGDKYGLAACYREEIAMLEEASRQPLPNDPQARVALIRKMHSNTGEGIGNVLDIESVSDSGDVLNCRRLNDEQMVKIFGTRTPNEGTLDDQKMSSIFVELGRGESVCFPIFDPREEPKVWVFAGYTVD